METPPRFLSDDGLQLEDGSEHESDSGLEGILG